MLATATTAAAVVLAFIVVAFGLACTALHLEDAFLAALDARSREEILQAVGDAHRAASGTAAAMRRREGLVEVDVHNVEAHIARAGYSEERIEVGSVVVHKAAGLVD